MLASNHKTTTDRFELLASILGISTIVETPFDFIKLANKGLNADLITHFKDYFKLPLSSISALLGTSEPSIYRWTKSQKTLERNTSVKIFEVTEVFLYGIEIFESSNNFFKWLKMPNTALGGMEPLQLLEIPGGTSKVKDVLGRIQYGVYS